MSLYKDMTKLLKEDEREHFRLRKFSINSDNFRARIQGIPCGDYIMLEQKATKDSYAETLMSNTPMEKRTNSEFVNRAHGDILIAGLGLGLVPIAIMDKPEVRSITIVEKENEIIDLITSQIDFNKKVKIIEDDIYMYRPETLFDCIYFDIWPTINSDVYRDMLFLKDGFKRYLKPYKDSPNRYIKCWAETQARYNHPLI